MLPVYRIVFVGARPLVLIRHSAAEALEDAAQGAIEQHWAIVEGPDRSVVLVVLEDGLVNTYGTPDALRAFGVGHLAESAA